MNMAVTHNVLDMMLRIRLTEEEIAIFVTVTKMRCPTQPVDRARGCAGNVECAYDASDLAVSSHRLPHIISLKAVIYRNDC